ncbi:hypothetical protein ACFY36_11940 [Actinoplanes sp. NPDC000266]
MTEDLRALLRDDLNAERPPPLGDVVGAALRDGKRIRRNRRRLAAGGGAAAVFGVLAVVVGGGAVTLPGPPEPGLGGVAAAPAGPAPAQRVTPRVTAPGRSGVPATKAPVLAPQSVPISPAAPKVRTFTRNLAISGTQRPVEKQTKATPEAMVYLLTELLPSTLTRDYSVAASGDLSVRAYLNDGLGPRMVQVRVWRTDVAPPRPARGQTAKVTIVSTPGDCERGDVVTAGWPDGTLVQIDLASCAAGGGAGRPPAPPVLDPDIAAKVAADGRWGVLMDESLVTLGDKVYPGLPVFAG